MVSSRSIKAQAGISLISLMVGVTISLISAVAMLSMYRHTIQISTKTMQMSVQDGERSSAMTITPLLLQDAGFGIVSASVSSNIIALSNASLSGSTLSGTSGGANSNALIWRFKTSGVTQCSALLAPADNKGLLLLGPVNCTNLSDASKPIWTSSRSLASVGGFSFTLSTVANCRQFGYSSSGRATVQITSNNANEIQVNSLSCLSNLVIAP
jgi:Tfp pilus assembly protein PilW